MNSKYAARAAPSSLHLRDSGRAEIPMTFSEVEQVIGTRLPPAARKHRALWSNNPSNWVMTKAWLAAGYETANVDMQARTLVFRKGRVPRTWASGYRERNIDSEAERFVRSHLRHPQGHSDDHAWHESDGPGRRRLERGAVETDERFPPRYVRSHLDRTRRSPARARPQRNYKTPTGTGDCCSCPPSRLGSSRCSWRRAGSRWALDPHLWFERFRELPSVTLAAMPTSVLVASTCLPGTPPPDPADRILHRDRPRLRVRACNARCQDPGLRCAGPRPCRRMLS